MGKKKAPNNAFYYYMVDLKAKTPSIKTMQEAASQAGALWQSMSQEEKRPYEEKAKQKKQQKNQGLKYTSNGQIIQVVEKEQQEKIQGQINMKSQIDKLINVALAAHSLESEIFHIAHINDYFYCQTNRRYYPAEIAIVAFNLRDGIMDSYQKIIYPRCVPLGYKYFAVESAEEVHKIVIDPDSKGTDMDAVFRDIRTLLKSQNSSESTYPVYVTYDLREKAENIFEGMAHDAGYNKSVIDIRSVEYLFYALRNASSKKVTFPTVSVAELELARDTFEFSQGMACSYHEHTDAPDRCSLAIVIRTVYSICNHCCKDLGIRLIPGQHVPLNASVEDPVKMEKDDEDDALSNCEPESDDEFKMSDGESESSWCTVKLHERYRSQQHSLFSQSSEMAQGSSSFGCLRRPASVSKVYSGGADFSDFPMLGRGRGRGRGLMKF